MSHSLIQKTPSFAVIGGDRRQMELARLLSQKGFVVQTFALEAVPSNSVLICETIEDALTSVTAVLLPVPLFRNNLLRLVLKKETALDEVRLTLDCDALLSLLPEGCHLFAGAIPAAFSSLAKEKQICCHDYLSSPFIRWQNTVATAEGVLAEAIFRSRRTLTGSNCLIFGCGHCGSTLLAYLQHFQCHVCVYDRDQQALARASLSATPITDSRALKIAIADSDFLFQTIPDFSLEADCAQQISEDAVFLDLASVPCRVPAGANAPVHLPSLPARLAPQSSGALFYSYLKQEGIV